MKPWTPLFGLLGAMLVMPAFAEPPERLLPDAPVRAFTLPHFGDNGDRAWLLSGTEGTYDTRGYFRIEDMVLQVFDPGEPLLPRLSITSGEAVIELETQMARGETYLMVQERGGDFTLAGRNWQWDGHARKIRVTEDARVSFRQALGPVLTLEP